MLVLIIGLIIFLGSHSIRIVAPAWRRQSIAAWGEARWKAAYTVVSIVGFVVLVWGYALARADAPVLYVAPSWMAHVTALLMVFSFIFLAASQAPAGRIKAALRHPMLVGIKIWAFAHLLVNGDLASLVLFAAFLAWAVWDRISVKAREKAGEVNVIVAGPMANDAIAVLSGLVFYGLFVWKLHYWLIGVYPLG